MLQQGIVVESTSPWLAPCVFVPKKDGEICICVDFRELNKRTCKNSYPLPLPDEVQERVGKSRIFSNQNADSLSRVTQAEPQPCVFTQLTVGPSVQELQEHRSKDSILAPIIKHLASGTTPEKAAGSLMKRWLQLWPQLKVKKHILYRSTRSPGTGEVKDVVVVPDSLRSYYLHQCHDAVSAGHQGYTKTLERLQQLVYWVGMAADVRKYCESCDTCQRSKLPKPVPAPLVNMPVGKPWEFVAVDILKVPPFQGSTYLLVLQDYYTKWLEAVPLADRKHC